MPNRLRTVLGVTVFITGLLLAWRAMHQAGTPAVVPQETQQHVEVAFSQTQDMLIATTLENKNVLINQAKRFALEAAGITPMPTPAQSSFGKIDLADAFCAQLSALLHGDYDASLTAMTDRGWPRPSEQRYEKDKARWTKQHERMKQVQIAPDSITARAIDPRSLADPKLDPVAGFGRSCYQTTPSDADDQPLPDLIRPQSGLIELRIRALLPNLHGEPQDVFIGYRFTWDTRIGMWRWIQTCVYRRPSDGPFGHLTPV